MNSLRTLMIGLALTFGVGCGPSHVRVSGYAQVAEPSLVYVDGVWVVVGHHYPLFYEGGYYWMWDDGRWLRSRYYDRGFARVRARLVPGNVRAIDRPRRYSEYRVRPGTRVYRAPPPRVRDHRDQRRHRR